MSVYISPEELYIGLPAPLATVGVAVALSLWGIGRDHMALFLTELLESEFLVSEEIKRLPSVIDWNHISYRP